AITRTLLDVACNDPNRDTGELVDRLRAVNTRAIDLTEALLLLSRADQRSFTREHVDLSLIAEEAAETLLPSRKSAASPSRPAATRPPPSAHTRYSCSWPRTSYTTRWSTTCPNRAPSGSQPASSPRLRCSPSRTPARSSPHSWLPRSPSRFFE